MEISVEKLWTLCETKPVEVPAEWVRLVTYQTTQNDQTCEFGPKLAHVCGKWCTKELVVRYGRWINPL